MYSQQSYLPSMGGQQRQRSGSRNQGPGSSMSCNSSLLQSSQGRLGMGMDFPSSQNQDHRRRSHDYRHNQSQAYGQKKQSDKLGRKKSSHHSSAHQHQLHRYYPEQQVSMLDLQQDRRAAVAQPMQLSHLLEEELSNTAVTDDQTQP